MITGNFYYLKDSYYKKFPDCNLIGNKEEIIEGYVDYKYCIEKNSKAVTINDKLPKELNAIVRTAYRKTAVEMEKIGFKAKGHIRCSLLCFPSCISFPF